MEYPLEIALVKKEKKRGRPRGGRYPKTIRDIWMWQKRLSRSNDIGQSDLMKQLKKDRPDIYTVLFGKKKKKRKR